jgi:hypothetical protein
MKALWTTMKTDYSCTGCDACDALSAYTVMILSAKPLNEALDGACRRLQNAAHRCSQPGRDHP